jgi:hypothetical protein
MKKNGLNKACSTHGRRQYWKRNIFNPERRLSPGSSRWGYEENIKLGLTNLSVQTEFEWLSIRSSDELA